jgi:predicted ATPase with chaperone activity
MVIRYQKGLSGPLLDRVDIYIDVPRVDYEELTEDRLGEPPENIGQRVEKARRFSASALPTASCPPTLTWGPPRCGSAIR